jgi:hypothetical protein
VRLYGGWKLAQEFSHDIAVTGEWNAPADEDEATVAVENRAQAAKLSELR